MRRRKRLFALVLAAAALALAAHFYNPQSDGVFRHTIKISKPSPEVSYPTALPLDTPEPTKAASADKPEIIPTTISGGLVLKNPTTYNIDVDELLAQGCPVRLKKGKVQVLIIHTHSSEAYSPAGLDKYKSSGVARTRDQEHNVVRVGEELKTELEKHGLNVIHDKTVHDYPSYTGSYSSCAETLEKDLAEYPSISVVIDLHRDAIGSDKVIYKTVAAEDGSVACQMMFVMGTDDAGLYHPEWQQNLRFALYLQNAVLQKYPSLMRPVQMVSYRYNEHMTTGSVILEVGSSGNTLQEALAAVRLFADAAGPALADLVE